MPHVASSLSWFESPGLLCQEYHWEGNQRMMTSIGDVWMRTLELRMQPFPRPQFISKDELWNSTLDAVQSGFYEEMQ